MPLPDSGTFTPALPVTASVVDRVPSAVGLNVSGMLDEFPGDRVVGFASVGGVNPVAKEKSALLDPVIARPLMMRGAVPELVTVRVWVALCESTKWSPKLTAVGFGVIAGEVPLPVKATFRGLPEALCAIAREAVRLPVLPGVKTKEILTF